MSLTTNTQFLSICNNSFTHTYKLTSMLYVISIKCFRLQVRSGMIGWTWFPLNCQLLCKVLCILFVMVSYGISLPSEEELIIEEVNLSGVVLRAASFYLGKRCENENNEFMLCRSERNDPRKCVTEGKIITKHSLGSWKRLVFMNLLIITSVSIEVALVICLSHVKKVSMYVTSVLKIIYT